MKKLGKFLAVIMSVLMLTSLMAGITFADENTVKVTVTFDYINYAVSLNGKSIEDGDVIDVVPGQKYTFDVELATTFPSWYVPEDHEYDTKKYFNAYIDSVQVNDASIDISTGSKSVTVSFTDDSVFAIAYKTITVSSSVVAECNRNDYGVSWELPTITVPYGTDCRLYINVKEGYIKSAKNANNVMEDSRTFLNSILYAGYRGVTQEALEIVGRGYTDILMWDAEYSDPDKGIYCFILQNLTNFSTLRVAQSGATSPANMIHLQPSTINVNFYLDEEGNELYTTETGTYDSLLAKPADPKKTGYGFAGWYTKDGQAYDFTSPVKTAEDLNLYAKWNANCHVQFIDQGKVYDEFDVQSGKTVTAPSKPTDGPTGTKFLGWYTSESDGQAYDFSTPVTGDLKLYARWGEAVSVTGIKLSKDSLLLATGETETLTATVLPENATDKKVTWTSSNADVASVNANGLVTAISYSKEPVTITATTSDGSFKASCQVQTRFYDVTQALVDAGTISSGTYTRIYWAADNGIVLGAKDEKGVTYFNLTGDCTRAQMAVMFYRYAGKPDVSAEAVAAAKEKFSDVSSLSSGVVKALAWAVSEGIIAGYNDGTFRPQNSISRASTVVMFWRMAGRPEAQGSSSFTDTASCSAGVMKAINWAASVGITKGTANGDGTYRFAPNDNCQRQHIVSFIYRYDLLEK